MKVKRWLKALPALVALLAIVILGAACGSEEAGEPDRAPAVTEAQGTPTEAATAKPQETQETPLGGGATIDVSLDEFDVTLSQETAGAGSVVFDVSNDGSIVHNFRVIKSELAVEDLPVSGAAVDEEEVDVVAASEEDLDSGTSEEVSAVLDAGSYVLICNVPGHYDAGMRVAFTVQ